MLVLDDLLLTPISSEEAKDLLEIVEDRNQLRSTMIVLPDGGLPPNSK